MDTFVIETDALTKRFGAQLAVDRVSMTVGRGEVYGLLGANGAGKTTTLRMLLGLVRPTSGTATVLGRPAGAAGTRRRVGALVEGPGFFPYLSGRANLRVLARYQGLPDGTVEAALHRVHLAERGKDRFETYSLGMKQRLGVAAALMGEPELVILDEPTNGLDPGGMADMRALVVALAREGRSVVLSSHLLAEVQEICDRVGVVSRGRLRHESTVAEMRGAASLRVRATPEKDALRVVIRVAGVDAVDCTSGGLLVRLEEDDAPRLVRELVSAGVDVHEVGAAERTLEDAFFAMTGPDSPTDEEEPS